MRSNALAFELDESSRSVLVAIARSRSRDHRESADSIAEATELALGGVEQCTKSLLEAHLVEVHRYVGATPDDYELTGAGVVLARLLQAQ